MMSSPSLRSIASPSIAAVVLAFTFVFGGVQAHAGYPVACSLENEVMKNSIEAAEELDVLCSYFAEDIKADNAELEVATIVANAQAPATSEIVRAAAVETPSSAIEGQAIRVAVNQTVTIAAPGEKLEKDEGADITGSVAPPQPKSIIASTQNELCYYLFDNPPAP